MCSNSQLASIWPQQHRNASAAAAAILTQAKRMVPKWSRVKKYRPNSKLNLNVPIGPVPR